MGGAEADGGGGGLHQPSLRCLSWVIAVSLGHWLRRLATRGVAWTRAASERATGAPSHISVFAGVLSPQLFDSARSAWPRVRSRALAESASLLRWKQELRLSEVKYAKTVRS